MLIQQSPPTDSFYRFVLYRNRLNFTKSYAKMAKSTVIQSHHAVDVWV